jgi:hypothetical protein
MTDVQVTQPEMKSSAVSQGLEQLLQKKGGQNVYYAIAFLLLVATMNGVQNELITKSKEIKASAAAQKEVISQLKTIVFFTIPKGATRVKIQQISEKNKIIADIQQELQASLVNLRQGAQILMTQGNTNVTSIEQDANSDSTILGTIHTILSLVNGMAPGKGK